MEPIKFIYKGRERIKRGTLSSFDDLPDYIKNDFISIKKFLVEHFGKEIEAYVHGSFKHGYWDELSDYDVIIYEKANCFELDKLIKETLAIKANIFPTQQKIGVILIP
jgi:predicted nucleotidyltransferase